MVQRLGDAAAHAQGASASQMRRYNERLLLQRLRRLGEASKADLARAAGLTNTAVGDIVRELEQQGLVRALGKKHDGARGQPATMLTLDAAGAYAIGVRLDRGRIESVLSDLGGTLLGSRTHDGPLPSPEAALAIVCRDIKALTRVLPQERRGRIAGVGLARPWNLGSWRRQLDLADADYAAWDDAPFAALLEEACGFAVAEENDGTAAAVAELFQGIGRRLDDFLYVFVGPAIGGGVVISGTSLRGARSNAGDIGVVPVGPSALSSGAAAPGPLLGRASLNVLMRHLRARGAAVAGLGGLTQALAQAPEAGEEWTRDAADALAWPLLTASALLDTATVVIDSDLDPAWVERLLECTRVAMQAACSEARTPPALRRGSFGPDAGALGAATLPLFLHYGPGSYGGGPVAKIGTYDLVA